MGDRVEVAHLHVSHDRLIGQIARVLSSVSSLYRAEIIRKNSKQLIIKLIDIPYESHLKLIGSTDILSSLDRGDIIEVDIDTKETIHPQKAVFVRRIATGADPERFLLFARQSLDLPGDFDPMVIESIPRVSIQHEVTHRYDYR